MASIHSSCKGSQIKLLLTTDNAIYFKENTREEYVVTTPTLHACVVELFIFAGAT